jgi:SAM-dependent methyltransferase
MVGCPICKSTEQTLLFEKTKEASEWVLNGVQYQYQRCNKCAFIQSNPIPPEKDLFEFYQKQYAYDWFEKNRFFKKIQARHRLFKIRNHVKGSKKILDFGCGHGYFVQELAKKQFQSFGFDIGSDKIMLHGSATITNKNQLSAYEEYGFDVISLWHVLEHMQDHDAILDDLKQRLNPGGKLIIAVPNTNSLAYKLVGQKWGWLQQPYVHINHYNSTNLGLLLESKGFTVCAVTTTDTWDQNLYDLLISYLFYKNKSRNTVRQFGDGAGGGVFFRVNQIVRLLFTPLSYFISFIRKNKKEGNELMMVAKK